MDVWDNSAAILALNKRNQAREGNHEGTRYVLRRSRVMVRVKGMLARPGTLEGDVWRPSVVKSKRFD